MRFLVTILLFSFFLFPCCAQKTAGVTIPAQQKFILGEYMNDAYTAKMDNRGSQLITVSLIDKESREVAQTIELESGASTKLDVAPSYEVHLQNATNKKGFMFVKMSKKVPGMRYVGKDDSGIAASPSKDTRVFLPAKDAGPAQESLTVTIPAGQQLVVGEGSSTNYTATINNRGGKEVKVSIRDKKTGVQTQGFGLRGSDQVSIRRHENIYLVNYSKKELKVKVTMSKPISGERLEAATEPAKK